MFDLGLTHDQVAAAKERAGTSVWNYFESLRTHNGLFPGAKFIVCVFIALYSLGALTGIAYSLGIEYVIVMVLAPPSTAAANLPPSMHPFAMQCARWIENRLPKPSRGNQSPVYMLSKALGDLSHLYTFGCLCLVTLPGPLRSGDKHFMDRGAPGLYLGPSEEGQCHLAYVFALRRVLPVAKIRVWEDEFPGLRGNKYRWFPDDPVVGSLSGWNQQRCALQRASWLCEWTSTGQQQFAAAYLCATAARRAFAPAPRRPSVVFASPFAVLAAPSTATEQPATASDQTVTATQRLNFTTASTNGYPKGDHYGTTSVLCATASAATTASAAAALSLSCFGVGLCS